QHRHQVVDDPRVDARRATGMVLPVLEGDPEIQSRMALPPGIDDGVVGHHRILRRVQADAGIAGVAHHVVAHHAAHGLVPARVHLRVQVLGAGVEADENAGDTGIFDPVALHQHVRGATLEVQAGGRDVVDPAVLDHHAGTVDVVDAVGIHLVDRRPRGIDRAGVADLHATDGDVVRLRG